MGRLVWPPRAARVGRSKSSSSPAGSGFVRFELHYAIRAIPSDAKYTYYQRVRSWALIIYNPIQREVQRLLSLYCLAGCMRAARHHTYLLQLVGVWSRGVYGCRPPTRRMNYPHYTTIHCRRSPSMCAPAYRLHVYTVTRTAALMTLASSTRIVPSSRQKPCMA